MDPQRFKRDFWRQVEPFDQILPLLDSLHDTAFFFKDLESRHTMNNSRAVASAGVASEAETLGKVGYEFWYPDRIALFKKQDQSVMKSGIPIINALCPTPERGSSAVIIFSKIPLRNRKGRIVGLAGVWRETDALNTLPPEYRKMSQILEHIQVHYSDPLTIGDLADRANLSRSQFGRLFRKMFGLSPLDYLKSIRTNAAAILLRDTQLKTTQIAINTGFYDHSHFSRTFRQIMGVTPREFRKKNALRPVA